MTVNIPFRSWSSEQVIDSADDYFEAVLNDISNASKTISLESYIFRYDKTGKKFCNALLDAANRGVQIRVLVDGVGSFDTIKKLDEKLDDIPGIDFKIFHPVPWRIDLYKYAITQKKTGFRFLYFLARLNRRDHRKLCIIDRQIAWAGSYNITDDHFPDHEGKGGWSDLAVRLEGEGIANLEEDFNEIWHNRYKGKRFARFRHFISTNTYAKRQFHHKSLMQAIEHANSRVWILAAYFSPSDYLLNSLIRARSLDIDVRIILPSHSDIRFFPLISRTYYKKLLTHGIHIYEYQEKILHSKAILFDNDCIVGSANMNHRSYLHDLEIDILLESSDSVKKIETVFNDHLENCKKIEMTDLYGFGRIQLIKGWFLRLFKYWL